MSNDPLKEKLDTIVSLLDLEKKLNEIGDLNDPLTFKLNQIISILEKGTLGNNIKEYSIKEESKATPYEFRTVALPGFDPTVFKEVFADIQVVGKKVDVKVYGTITEDIPTGWEGSNNYPNIMLFDLSKVPKEDLALYLPKTTSPSKVNSYYWGQTGTPFIMSELIAFNCPGDSKCQSEITPTNRMFIILSDARLNQSAIDDDGYFINYSFENERRLFYRARGSQFTIYFSYFTE